MRLRHRLPPQSRLMQFKPVWLPSALFALSQPGIWLDGSDNSVMWQDAAGTTPVTALGQSVGLVLDKRLWGGKTLAQVLAEQPELRGDGAIGLAGTATAATYDTGTGEAVASRGSNANNQSYVQWSGLTVNGSYAVDVESTGATDMLVRNGSHTSGATTPVAAGQRQTVLATAATGLITLCARNNTTTANFTVHSIKHVPGNHASQSTSASRPVWQEDDLGARGLLFDGVNDFLVTPSINFSASDKVMMAAGVRKLSDVNIAILAELSASVNTNGGTFFFSAPVSDGNPNYSFRSKGTVMQTAQYTDAAVAAPSSNVLVGLGDIGGDISRLRVDGGQVAENTGDQGTGNYGNYPLYIGRRGEGALPFSGFIHQLVIRGGAWPDTDELAQLEAYLASKSKVTL